jgi:UDP-glucose 4-epimerase
MVKPDSPTEVGDGVHGPTGQTVLVTGGGGFIGNHLVSALTEHNEVRVLDDFSTGRRSVVPDNVDVVVGDIRDAETTEAAVEGVDTVFHQAANVSVTDSADHPTATNAVNLDGTLNLLEAARSANARLVFASSCAVYGDPESVPVPESAPLRPASPYGVQKAAGDRYTRLYAELYGLETVALRYFNVYGPGRYSGGYSGVIRVFLSQAREGEDVTIEGDGTQTRDFVHISDVVRANLAAATTDHTGEAFNVATGTETSVTELAETITDVVDSSSDIVHVAARDGDIAQSCGDTDHAQTGLGFETAVDLREGLEQLATVSSTHT